MSGIGSLPDSKITETKVDQKHWSDSTLNRQLEKVVQWGCELMDSLNIDMRLLAVYEFGGIAQVFENDEGICGTDFVEAAIIKKDFKQLSNLLTDENQKFYETFEKFSLTFEYLFNDLLGENKWFTNHDDLVQLVKKEVLRKAICYSRYVLKLYGNKPIIWLIREIESWRVMLSRKKSWTNTEKWIRFVKDVQDASLSFGYEYETEVADVSEHKAANDRDAVLKDLIKQLRPLYLADFQNTLKPLFNNLLLVKQLSDNCKEQQLAELSLKYFKSCVLEALENCTKYYTVDYFGRRFEIKARSYVKEFKNNLLLQEEKLKVIEDAGNRVLSLFKNETRYVLDDVDKLGGNRELPVADISRSQEFSDKVMDSPLKDWEAAERVMTFLSEKSPANLPLPICREVLAAALIKGQREKKQAELSNKKILPYDNSSRISYGKLRWYLSSRLGTRSFLFQCHEVPRKMTVKSWMPRLEKGFESLEQLLRTRKWIDDLIKNKLQFYFHDSSADSNLSETDYPNPLVATSHYLSPGEIVYPSNILFKRLQCIGARKFDNERLSDEEILFVLNRTRTTEGERPQMLKNQQLKSVIKGYLELMENEFKLIYGKKEFEQIQKYIRLNIKTSDLLENCFQQVIALFSDRTTREEYNAFFGEKSSILSAALPQQSDKCYADILSLDDEDENKNQNVKNPLTPKQLEQVLHHLRELDEIRGDKVWNREDLNRNLDNVINSLAELRI